MGWKKDWKLFGSRTHTLGRLFLELLYTRSKSFWIDSNKSTPMKTCLPEYVGTLHSRNITSVCGPSVYVRLSLCVCVERGTSYLSFFRFPLRYQRGPELLECCRCCCCCCGYLFHLSMSFSFSFYLSFFLSRTLSFSSSCTISSSLSRSLYLSFSSSVTLARLSRAEQSRRKTRDQTRARYCYTNQCSGSLFSILDCIYIYLVMS